MDGDLELEDSIDGYNSVKIVMLGESGVGKTSLALRFIEGVFPAPKPTIAVSYFSKKLFIDTQMIVAKIWDTSGQERFRSLVPLYYRGASSAVVVFDITSMETFQTLKFWVEELKSNIEGEIKIFVVANKCDLEKNRQVSKEESMNYAKSIGAKFFQTSALSGECVQELFRDACIQGISITDNKSLQNQNNAQLEPKEDMTNQNPPSFCC
ncbi:ras-related protein rab-5c [Anaeramoeba ignava]|uniref:Ras-related protein rab-5c n=1 Tax=Anaeramoeba ignava TaxID=1746090 RepID=A0A9Q0RDI8_ANAIG|nr:ras-related protein rab-5c [Anaeramoeba ignava]